MEVSTLKLSSIKNIDTNKLINFFLVGYAFCLPISKAGVNFFEILMLITWIIQGNWKEKISLYLKNPIIIAMLIFILISSISILWAESLSYGLNYISKYRHFLIILIIYTALDKKFIKYIFSGFLIGMFISEFISYGIFFEWFRFKNISPTDPSPFMSHTDYSVYLAFTSVILLFRFFHHDGTTVEKMIYALFFLSVTANLFINGGRTGQIIFIILMLLTFMMYSKNKLKSFLLSMLFIILVYITAYNKSPNFHNRANYTYHEVQNMIINHDFRGSFSTRIALWIVGIDKFLDNPYFGVGMGNEIKDIKMYASKYKVGNHLVGFPDHHNTFITIGLHSGIIALLSILFICYSLLSLKFKSKEYKLLSLTFIIGFILWSLGGHTLHLMNSMIFFSLFAGLFNKLSAFDMMNEIQK